jgi:hypothetical protein
VMFELIMGSKAGGFAMASPLIFIIHYIVHPLLYSGLLVCPALYADLFSTANNDVQSLAQGCFVQSPFVAQLLALHGVSLEIKQYLFMKSSLG